MQDYNRTPYFMCGVKKNSKKKASCWMRQNLESYYTAFEYNIYCYQVYCNVSSYPIGFDESNKVTFVGKPPVAL